MKLRKSDWTLVREAEAEGRMVGMTGTVERKRTELNNQLMAFFREQLPNFGGYFDAEEGEDILGGINDFFKEKEINKHPIDFPMTSGSDIYLIPITEHLQLKLLVVDEYYGDGDYAKYVMADFFMMTEETTEADVLELVSFIRTYFNM